MFRKPGTKKTGAKVLLVGEKGTGKTITALSFPSVAALDAENGMTFYEDKPEGKNLVGVQNTQSFYDLEEAIEIVEDEYEDMGVKTLVIDSETKFYSNIQETIMEVEEKRARSKGRDVLDTNLSVRSWGKIKQISEKLQNMKIDLTSKGIHLVSIAQIKDKKKQVGNEFKVVGFDVVMNKGAEYDYDIVLKQYTEKNADGEETFFAKVLKDRTQTFSVGDIVENPRYELWKDALESNKKKEAINSNYSKDDAKDRYEAEAEAEDTPVEDRVKEIYNLIKENKDQEEFKKFKKAFSDRKIPQSMKDLTASQKDKLREIYEEFKDYKGKEEE